MAVSYKKLWKLLTDKDMKKQELEQQAKVSHYTVSKMYRGECYYRYFGADLQNAGLLS